MARRGDDRTAGGAGGEGTPRRGRVRTLAQALQPVVRPLLKDRPLAEAQLLLDWPEIVGEHFAALCRPLKVRFARRGERRDGVLELACSGPAALELQHASPQLIQRVNAFLGYPAIARLGLKQVLSGPAAQLGPRRPAAPAAAPATPAPAGASSGDERLDRALAGLGAAVASRRRPAGK